MTFEEILVALVISFVAGVAGTRYIKFREAQTRRKIEDLSSHEKYLEKLSKGNIKLLRTSLTLVLICLFLLFVSSISILASVVIDPPALIRNIFYLVSMCSMSIGAGLCFHQARSIIQSSDLKNTKQKIQAKRQSLERKIT